jgi:hypothetical protein
MRRLLLPIVASILVLPATLAHLAIDALTDPDPHRRGDAALVLVVALALIGWACGVFKD